VNELNDITAAILAGGLGTRLRPAVADLPKSLAAVSGRPFLAYLLDQLDAAGIRNVVLCTGYKASSVADEFGTAYRGLKLVYSKETTPLGTGGALRHALERLVSDPVLVLNGDSYCSVDLPAFVAEHRRAAASASVALAEVADTSRYGRVTSDPRGAITGFVEKAACGGPGWINAGLYLLSQRFLQSLPLAGSDTAAPLSLEREVFPRWVGRGLVGHFSRTTFIDIGTPESYAQAGHVLASGAIASGGVT
jgi:NDP-sugar pyrophosphorylase family protein